MVTYNFESKEAVTINDYNSLIRTILEVDLVQPKAIMEEDNKIKIEILSLDSNGKLVVSNTLKDIETTYQIIE